MEYIVIQEEQSLLDLSSKEHDLFFSEDSSKYIRWGQTE